MDVLTSPANAEAILNLYSGPGKSSITGLVLTITGTGDQTEAALVAKGFLPDNTMRELGGSLVIIQGPYDGSDIDALLALHDVTKLALTRARSRSLLNARSYGCGFGFSNFAQLRSSA
jgi:hypothetical protein